MGIKCPHCREQISGKITKEWDYNVFHVKKYECENCSKVFMAYYKGDKFSHIIPK